MLQGPAGQSRTQGEASRRFPGQAILKAGVSYIFFSDTQEGYVIIVGS